MRHLVTTSLVAALALAVGVGGGYAMFAGGGAPAAASGSPMAGADSETWYTCGMHPEVLSPEPGTCPQCNMKLTPLKVGGDDDDDDADPAATKDRKIKYWVAPMDPGYVRDGPGKSPMGMDLVPVYADEISGGPSVKIDPVTQQNMGIRTAVVEKGPLVRNVRTVGTVAYDETRLGIVTLKVGGFIEKLHVDQTGAQVHRGDPLFDMYAPEVVQAQDEYLQSLANYRATTDVAAKARWKSLLDQSRVKLLRWDLDEEQIADLEKRGHAQQSLTWRSPFDGIVVHKNVVEGQRMMPGEPLYRIADLSTVWVYVSIYEFEFPWVRTGQEARMKLPYYPGETFTGKVDYLYPYLDPKSRDRKVRLVFPNPGHELLPDMFATVEIHAKLADEAVLVPGEAVLDTGVRQVVFVVRGKGRFEPRNVRVGVEAKGGRREVLKGLVPGDVVVTSGQFLLDSESKVKEAIQKMLEARSGKTDGGMAQAGGGMEPDGAMAPGTAPGAGGGTESGGAETTATPTPAATFETPPGLTAVVPEHCAVMGGEPVPDVFTDYKGHRFFFCCTGCPTRFLADPGKYIEKLRRMGLEIDIDTTGTPPDDGR